MACLRFVALTAAALSSSSLGCRGGGMVLTRRIPQRFEARGTAEREACMSVGRVGSESGMTSWSGVGRGRAEASVGLGGAL
jgi:hypothetical protein